jgi:colanic acid biosynthesis glycosyl transferase WcaI
MRKNGNIRHLKLLLINQYFYPDMAATAQLLTDLAMDLSSKDWAVTALAGRGRYAGNSRQLHHREFWNGISIQRVWCTDFGRRSSSGRMLDYLTFLVSAGFRVLLSRRYDVVVCLSTPPLIGLLGLLAQIRGGRFIYKVEDLYPDIALALGMLKAGHSAKLLAWLSGLLLSKADVVVALDKSMADCLIQRGARSVVVIPNWADGTFIYPLTSEEQLNAAS